MRRSGILVVHTANPVQPQLKRSGCRRCVGSMRRWNWTLWDPWSYYKPPFPPGCVIAEGR
eukprot:COSAG01_NODE_1398_length_10466_cov_173.518086_11_plen_60_part_00